MARDVIAVIRADHERITELLDELTGARIPPPGWRGGPLTLVQRLVIAESRHEVAEEQWLWPAVRALADPPGAVVRAGLRQEQRSKRMLKALERAAAGDAAAYPESLQAAATALRTHIDFEERLVLPALEQIMDPEIAADLAARVERSEKRGPTRPHPLTPPVPGILRIAGRLVGPVDRLRDFTARRGRLA